MKGRKIRNLTREDISIVDYKKMLVKNSTLSGNNFTYWLTDKRRFRRTGESQTVQQNSHQGQDINARVDPASVHLACCTPLCLLYGRRTLHMFRFHHHRLDRFNALVHVLYTKIHRRIRNVRTPIPTTKYGGGIQSSSSSSLMRSSSLKMKSCVWFVRNPHGLTKRVRRGTYPKINIHHRVHYRVLR